MLIASKFRSKVKKLLEDVPLNQHNIAMQDFRRGVTDENSYKVGFIDGWNHALEEVSFDAPDEICPKNLTEREESMIENAKKTRQGITNG